MCFEQRSTVMVDIVDSMWNIAYNHQTFYKLVYKYTYKVVIIKELCWVVDKTTYETI